MNPRDRILETASRLFYTQGYNNTGINQLIKAAKVAKASFYEYFPSKEDLLLEYLKVAAERTNTLLRAAVEKAAYAQGKRCWRYLITCCSVRGRHITMAAIF